MGLFNAVVLGFYLAVGLMILYKILVFLREIRDLGKEQRDLLKEQLDRM